MTFPKRILAATDFSECGERACEFALELAAVFGARLDWTHVVEVSEESVPLFSDAPQQSPIDQALKLARMKLDAWQRRAEQSGLRSVAQCAQGGAGNSVVARAAELGADLIVVGSHGRGALGHALIGSVAERIVREAGCSVLVARGKASLADGRPIVLGEDLGPSSQRARELAAGLAEARDLPLRVVHAIDVGIPYLATLEVMLPREMMERLYGDAREQLAAIAQEFPEVRISHEAISSERPSNAICEAAERAGAGLIVVGSHSRRGLERLLIGSNAERVVRHAPCSVLVAR